MADDRTNVVLIMADDMNWDAVGAFGCPTEGTTPNLDRLASEGMRFNFAHVTAAVCQPSRSALMTGRFPHNSGGEGFHRLRKEGVPILPNLLRQAGYRVGIMGKVPHSTPYADFKWDMEVDQGELGFGRNPDVYFQHADEFLRESISQGKPFFLMANSHDPHRPFYGNDRSEWYEEGNVPSAAIPSRVFTPEEVVIPDFLPDLPQVRLEISEYYSSARRCDDTVGKVLQVLEETGQVNNTLVMFLSDNGMAFPFAKTNCYLNSTRTPWIARWPGKISPGSVDKENFISGVDFTPTVLDVTGVEAPNGMDGASFLDPMLGRTQEGRDTVFTQFHQTSMKRNYPMRAVQNRRFGYIFNPWSDGKREFRNESLMGRTFNAMEEAAPGMRDVADRVQMFLYRVPEEFYDFENDPSGLNNLIDDPDYADEVDRLRQGMVGWMERTGDSALEVLQNRTSQEARDAYLDRLAEEIGIREN